MFHVEHMSKCVPNGASVTLWTELLFQGWVIGRVFSFILEDNTLVLCVSGLICGRLKLEIVFHVEHIDDSSRVCSRVFHVEHYSLKGVHRSGRLIFATTACVLLPVNWPKLPLSAIIVNHVATSSIRLPASLFVTVGYKQNSKLLRGGIEGFHGGIGWSGLPCGRFWPGILWPGGESG
jgi:hypothetical protein